MNFQNTNQTKLENAANENAWAMLDLLSNGDMTIEETVDATIPQWMDESYDEDQFDAPYDVNQIRPIIKTALIQNIIQSANGLRKYATANESAYIRDYDAQNEIGEGIVVRVIEIEGEEFEVVYGETKDLFFA